jgi:hypothetical protein
MTADSDTIPLTPVEAARLTIHARIIRAGDLLSDCRDDARRTPGLERQCPEFDELVRRLDALAAEYGDTN